MEQFNGNNISISDSPISPDRNLQTNQITIGTAPEESVSSGLSQNNRCECFYCKKQQVY